MRQEDLIAPLTFEGPHIHWQDDVLAVDLSIVLHLMDLYQVVYDGPEVLKYVDIAPQIIREHTDPAPEVEVGMAQHVLLLGLRVHIVGAHMTGLQAVALVSHRADIGILLWPYLVD